MKQPRAQTMSSFVSKCEKENIELPQVSARFPSLSYEPLANNGSIACPPLFVP